MPTSQRIQITPANLLKWTKVLPISSLSPHPRNPRIGNVERIETSIERHGQFRSIGVSEDLFILFGNHTYQAMMAQGVTEVVAHVLPLAHDHPQAIEILLADNHAGDDSEYDNTLLVEALKAVEGEYDNIVATLYTEDEYAKLLAQYEKELRQEDKKDPDDVAAPPTVAITKPGDIWLLGPHRLVCGDSTDAVALDKVMGHGRADLVWTDPPYGVSYQDDIRPNAAHAHKRRKDGKKVLNDKMSGDELEELLDGSLSLAATYCNPGACFYVASPPGPLHLLFAAALLKLDILRQTLIWDKGSLVQGRSDYQYQHEPILYGWLGEGHQRVEDRTQTSVWRIGKPSRSPMHPTMKPVELVIRSINNSTRHGATVLDPFAGSGTVLIAAYLTRRIARLVELDPIYCDVICRRWQEQSDEKPVLEATGEVFDFIPVEQAA